MILGTAGYMSPEQARGKPVDKRADIWAFGVVLYEMLTGRRAFQGETASDSIAKILEREPDWQLLPPHTPAIVRKLLRDCLKKEVRERLQAIGDARVTLQELIADPDAFVVETEIVNYPLWKKILPWAVAPLLFIAAWLVKPAPKLAERASEKFEISLPAGMTLSSDMMFLAKNRGSIPKDLGINTVFFKDKRKPEDIIEEVDVPVVNAEENYKFKHDPAGSFKIMVEDRQIKAVHYLKTIPQIAVKGNTAKAVYDEIIKMGLISRVEHASYLGSELEKAEIASKVGKKYIQDFPLFRYIY